MTLETSKNLARVPEKTAQKPKADLGQRLSYEFDKSMAAGPIALIGWLALISIFALVMTGLFLAVTRIAPTGEEPMSFLEGFWVSLMRTLDSGTMGGDIGWAFRLTMLLVTIFGMLVVAALIGVVSTGLDGKLEELRKGRSKVLEYNHTIILNWSPSIFDIVSELCIANASEKAPRIVIMANRDKVEMEQEIRSKVGNTGRTRIIIRSGDPTDLFDLGLVNPQTSKSIIVTSPEGAKDPDSQVIKSILALTNAPSRRQERYKIVAELADASTMEVARIVGGDEVQLVLADELISRILVHSIRQPGLASIYTEILDFDGCEIYVVPASTIVGKTFGEALLMFESSALIGLCSKEDAVSINPPMDSLIEEGSKLVIIAEDDASIRMADHRADDISTEAIRTASQSPAPPERLLILGWNHRGSTIVQEISRFVAFGSHVVIAGDAASLKEDVAKLSVDPRRLGISVETVDTSKAAQLEGLNIASFDGVLVLGYADDLPAQSADTRTLITLLHLREASERTGRHIKVVSEMIDVRNRELAEVTRADDYIVSNKLVSLMLAQASENPYLAAIIDDLLDEQGSEIYLRPVGDYVDIQHPISFYSIVESARRRGEVAFGYRRSPEAGNTSDKRLAGVVVNPSKRAKVLYHPEDRVIVLAST